MNRRNLITAIIGIIVIITGVIAYVTHFVVSAQHIPAGKFIKISNVDLAPKGKVIIVEQSWYGCPVGAAASWAIYDFLQHYGNLSYKLWYSDPYRTPANIPGLLFTNFTSNSIVDFYIAYVYNEYLNASYNGTPIPQNELVPVGEQIIKEEYTQMGALSSSPLHYPIRNASTNTAVWRAFSVLWQTIALKFCNTNLWSEWYLHCDYTDS